MTEAVALQIEGLKADGIDAPEPRTGAVYVDIPEC
jgi:hypothetical protein